MPPDEDQNIAIMIAKLGADDVEYQIAISDYEKLWDHLRLYELASSRKRTHAAIIVFLLVIPKKHLHW